MNKSSTIEHLKRSKCKGFVREKAVCKDGFVISIQASGFHYCSPRQDLEDCNYNSVEIKLYGEDELFGILEDGIVGWASIEDVDKLIKKHGGLKDE